MSKIKSELLLASKNKANGVILYTFRLTYPRFILAEMLTHRVMSRNTSSTRAIPTLKMIKAVWSDMFVPQYIGTAQKGMQAGAELTGLRRKLAVTAWKLTGYAACIGAYALYKLGVAKQIAGRVLEPWSWVTQIVSTTEVHNFFRLRNHWAAEPHLGYLAAEMEGQVEEAKAELSWMKDHNVSGIKNSDSGTRYQILNPGEWHLPLILSHEQWNPVTGLKKISAARCARTSYTLVETGKASTPHADLVLCEKLIEGSHLSPFEHQAMAVESDGFIGNFCGWLQFRKELEA